MSLHISDIHRTLGPCLVTGLSGTELTVDEREILGAAPPAGVILFGRNVDTVEQLRRLTSEIRMTVRKASGLEPLIMADHEGGRISVLSSAIGTPPSQMAAWRSRSPVLLERIMRDTLARMRSCGLNTTLSPVADVASQPLNPVIGTRSFGEDPDSVSAAVRTAVKAVASSGMLSCIKHFPGHGSTVSDSHLTLPVLGKGFERLRSEDLPPFSDGIKAGADMVMSAHIALEKGGRPSSLERTILKSLLRDELGFEGTVITDALEMAGALPDGIAMRSVDPSAPLKGDGAVPALIAAEALEAGNDLLLMSRPAAEVYRELDAHSASVLERLSGQEAGRMLRASAGRVTALREKAFLAGVPGGRPTDLPGSGGGDGGPGRELMKALLEGGSVSGGHTMPVFAGEKSDFDSPVVRRFIAGVLRAYTGRTDPELRIDPSPAGTGGLLVFEPPLGSGGRRCLVLLCRRALPERQVREVAGSFDLVVAAERPWDAGLVREGIRVIITYGIFDAAASWIGKALRNGAGT